MKYLLIMHDGYLYLLSKGSNIMQGEKGMTYEGVESCLIQQYILFSSSYFDQ
jgi:hypothetical protein